MSQASEPESAAIWRLGRVAGIGIRLHLSVGLFFALIVTALARGTLPAWHPEWSSLLIWASALAAGVLFLLSLLAHELAHALVAARAQLKTRTITLFLFGGMAEIEKEPDNPQDELRIALAGPAMSLAISVLCLALTGVFADDAMRSAADAADGIAHMSAPVTVLFWLGAVNLMLGVFNLIPGFPMDGGRVYRALLWWRKGDLAAATRAAAGLGAGIGWGFVALGALNLLQGNTMNGLWLVLIGWFISRLARASGAQFQLERALAHASVATLMRTRFDRVPATATLAEFVDAYLLRSSQVLWPVADADGSDVGVISVDDLPAERGRAHLASIRVENCMRPLDAGTSLNPGMSGKEALRRLASQTRPLPVLDQSGVVGLLHEADVLRWVTLQ